MSLLSQTFHHLPKFPQLVIVSGKIIHSKFNNKALLIE
jgi:hypothetical protein